MKQRSTPVLTKLKVIQLEEPKPVVALSPPPSPKNYHNDNLKDISKFQVKYKRFRINIAAKIKPKAIKLQLNQITNSPLRKKSKESGSHLENASKVIEDGISRLEKQQKSLKNLEFITEQNRDEWFNLLNINFKELRHLKEQGIYDGHVKLLNIDLLRMHPLIQKLSF